MLEDENVGDENVGDELKDYQHRDGVFGPSEVNMNYMTQSQEHSRRYVSHKGWILMWVCLTRL